MKIYITGIAGMLGYSIFQELNQKADIRGIDIADFGQMFPEKVYNRISVLNLDELEADICLDIPDVIIHTVALVNVDLCEKNNILARELNVKSTENLIYICNKHDIKLIFISTDAVFDGKNNKLYNESDRINPINYYGKTKAEAEKLVLKYENNMVVRTNIYGMNIQSKSSFGEWIVKSLEKREKLKMFVDIDFSPILVNELSHILYECIIHDLKGLYHICGSGSITKYEFGRFLAKEFGYDEELIQPSSSEDHYFIAKRSKHMGLSNEKIINRLNIKISTPQESIVKFYKLLNKGDNNGN